MSESLLLLDTHAWVWSVAGDPTQLGSTARERLEGAARRGALRVAAISVWEVARLRAKGRIQLSVDIGVWVREALSGTGMQLVPLDPDISIESTRLPGEFHGDPADRMIVATARVIGAALLTRDRGILEYARQGHLQVVDAAR